MNLIPSRIDEKGPCAHDCVQCAPVSIGVVRMSGIHVPKYGTVIEGV